MLEYIDAASLGRLVGPPLVKHVAWLKPVVQGYMRRVYRSYEEDLTIANLYTRRTLY